MPRLGCFPSLGLRTGTGETANYRRLLGFVFRFFFSQAKEFVMSNLTTASRELFKRQPDECYPSLTALWEHCQRQKEEGPSIAAVSRESYDG